MQIIFNGKTYNSPEEIPANEHQAYEQMFQILTDKNGNGIPDFLEGDIAKNVMTAFTNAVNYDGKVYNSLDELPVDVREKIQDAFSKLKQLGVIGMNQPAQETQAFEPAFQASKPLIPQEPAIQEEGGKRWMLILGFLAAMMACAVGLAVFLFLL